MPRHVPNRLQWSSTTRTYEICTQGDINPIAPGSPAWFQWIDTISSFAFQSRSGAHCTVRREKIQDGETYWYAYRSFQGKTLKRYLGKSIELTISHLEQVADALSEKDTSAIKTMPEERGKQPVPVSYNVRSKPQTTITSKSQSTNPLNGRLRTPRLPALLIERTRLFKQLDTGIYHKLMLLIAPAGFGKTTLVSHWLSSRGTKAASLPTSWVSLDDGDNDPVRFWRTLIAACQHLRPGLGETALATLSTQSEMPFVAPSLEEAIASLLTDLSQLNNPGLLVLDDYHLITEPYIHKTMIAFLEDLPAPLHVIVLARSEPPFPLIRWRARGELYDFYTNNLRFSQEETTSFLQQTLDQPLSEAALLHLDHYVEGWAVGLRLLALSLREKRTPREVEEHLLTLENSQQSIQDFFISEILASQPEPIQHFLLHTSGLYRLNGSLCAELTSREDSTELLQKLAHAGLFLEALDSVEEEERWYRYHTLFAESLRAEANRRLGMNTVLSLVSKASLWFEQHGLHTEAIEAALQAKNVERVAALTEQLIARNDFQPRPENLAPARVSNEFHTFCRWLEQVPDDILSARPALCFSYAKAILYTFVIGEVPFSAERIARLQDCLRMAQEGWQRLNDRPQLGEVVAFQAMLANRYGAIEEAEKLARQALKYLPEENNIWRMISLGVTGSSVLLSGQINQARQLLQPGSTPYSASHGRAFARPGVVLFSRICIEQVNLRQAQALLLPMLAEARKDEDRDDIGDAQIELARISYAFNDLDAAEQQAQEALEVGQQLENEETIVHAALILARIQQARGETSVALQKLAELLALLPPNGVPLRTWLYREILTEQTQLQLDTGDFVAVERWTADRSQPTVTLPRIQQEQEEILVARWQLAQGNTDTAVELLGSMLNEALEAGRLRNALEMQILMARAYAARKQMRETRHLLQNVLAHACPENYQRLFLNEGELVTLLQQILPGIHTGTQASFVRSLLRSFHNNGDKHTSVPGESLSAQELRVLRLLIAGNSNPTIATELIVSVNTVKTQIQSIYRKLQVNNRVEAVEAARMLDLL